MTTREKDAEEANEQDATIARLEDMIVPGSGERIASGETYDGPQCENCARLEAEVAEYENTLPWLKIISANKEIARLEAEVAKLKAALQDAERLAVSYVEGEIEGVALAVAVDRLRNQVRERGLLEE